MRKASLLGASLGVLLFSSSVDAKVLDLYAQAQGGGGYGKGIAGFQKDEDFFEGAAGASYGARLGAEFLFFDGWIEHAQYTDFSSITATWTQFMFGADWDFPLGETEQGKKPKTFGEIGIAVGYGVGTGRQVEPPLDASELTDRGFLGQLSLGADYRINKVLSIGVTLPITYGYMFKDIEEGGANRDENQYQSISGAVLLHFRFHLELK